ncbi:MAG TPA: aminodeoxychorismate synthase component I [Pyrinomonadaceae bacterium]
MKTDGFAFSFIVHRSEFIVLLMFARELQLSADELVGALLRLDASRRVQILDSGGARGDDARFLIAGFDPFETIEARGGRLQVYERDGLSAHQVESADVLSVLDERLAKYRVPRADDSSRPASGACIATFAYELAHSLERLRSRRHAQAATTNAEPDAVLAFYDTLVIHDYARSTTEVVSVAGPEPLNRAWETIKRAAAERKAREQSGASDASSLIFHQDSASHASSVNVFESTVASNFTREQYCTAVELIKEHIAAGDIYQANLTQQFSVALDARLSPERVFLNLRRDHPASFAAYLRRREDTVVSASPERFLRVSLEENGTRTIEAWPIKGTRPRDVNAAEDERLRAELSESEKDRAENVMIVDLLRNDLGRVCLYGSVVVTELFTVQEHPTLFHLVSKVRGALREEVTAGCILRAAFPCGSITGAPKIRAMEIIDEIETAPRGLSMGAIGYFSFDGAIDLNVAIRTMVITDGVSRFNTGGGIVADSRPSLEYEESLTKARALLRALGVREGSYK